MIQRSGFLIPILFSALFAHAQNQTDTTVTDSGHCPRKATIYSAVLPGLGQAYNKKYWKIPVIYGTLATLGYFIYDNHAKYQIYKDAYSVRTDEDSLTVDEFVELYTDENLKGLRDYYRRNFELTCIITFAVYALNILDATVDAHLYEFEVNDDLTLKFQPQISPNIVGSPTYGGVKITLKF